VLPEALELAHQPLRNTFGVAEFGAPAGAPNA
jgi:hypothetical protein